MKTLVSLSLLIILSSTLLVQCKKHADDSVYQSSFYKSQDHGQLFLYINGTKQGELPYFSQRPECGARNSEGATPIILTLPSGEYSIEGRDSLGHVRTCSTMFISRNYTSGSSGGCGTGGGAEMFKTEDCLIYGIWDL